MSCDLHKLCIAAAHGQQHVGFQRQIACSIWVWQDICAGLVDWQDNCLPSYHGAHHFTWSRQSSPSKTQRDGGDGRPGM